MAKIDEGTGSIRASCPGCEGATSSFHWHSGKEIFGAYAGPDGTHFRLYKCAGCGRGGIATTYGFSLVDFPRRGGHAGRVVLLDFHPESCERLSVPKAVPEGIKREFQEGETCIEAKAYRAAAAMFRSVLDKVLRANGYKVKKGTTLEQQIDLAADDGVITGARKRKAHEDVRVLGNDVLHDEWRDVSREDVYLARHYAQRVLEDFYDDRDSVVKLLHAAKRLDENGDPITPP